MSGTPPATVASRKSRKRTRRAASPTKMDQTEPTELPPTIRWNREALRERALDGAPPETPDSFRWGHLSKLQFYVQAMHTHLGRRRDPDFDAEVDQKFRYTGSFAYDLQKIIDEATEVQRLMQLEPRRR